MEGFGVSPVFCPLEPLPKPLTRLQTPEKSGFVSGRRFSSAATGLFSKGSFRGGGLIESASVGGHLVLLELSIWHLIGPGAQLLLVEFDPVNT